MNWAVLFILLCFPTCLALLIAYSWLTDRMIREQAKERQDDE